MTIAEHSEQDIIEKWDSHGGYLYHDRFGGVVYKRPGEDEVYVQDGFEEIRDQFFDENPSANQTDFECYLIILLDGAY